LVTIQQFLDLTKMPGHLLNCEHGQVEQCLDQEGDLHKACRHDKEKLTDNLLFVDGVFEERWEAAMF
jgi:hypothetical protein